MQPTNALKEEHATQLFTCCFRADLSRVGGRERGFPRTDAASGQEGRSAAARCIGGTGARTRVRILRSVLEAHGPRGRGNRRRRSSARGTIREEIWLGSGAVSFPSGGKAVSPASSRRARALQKLR